MNNVNIWVDKYRPKTIDECVLPPRIKVALNKYVEVGEIPNLIFSGKSGIGKTTSAIALCKQVGCDYLMINGSDENGIDTFRNKIKMYAAAVSFTGKRKVIIIDEADYLNANSFQPAMRSAIEEFSNNCTFILTCNHRNRLMPEMVSRFAEVKFNPSKEETQTLKIGALKVVVGILKNENANISDKVAASVLKKTFPDLRKCINELQHMSRMNVTEHDVSATGSDFEELFSTIRNREFNKMRLWVASTPESQDIYRVMYDNLTELFTPESIPQAILLLARYQYQAAFVSDLEINTVACLTEVMTSCETR